jgi:hypothetical protein
MQSLQRLPQSGREIQPILSGWGDGEMGRWGDGGENCVSPEDWLRLRVREAIAVQLASPAEKF